MKEILIGTTVAVVFVSYVSACFGAAVAEVARGRKSLVFFGLLLSSGLAAAAHFATGFVLGRLDPAVAQTMDIAHGGPIAAIILAGVAFVCAFAPCLHRGYAMWREKIYMLSHAPAACPIVLRLFDRLSPDANDCLTLEAVKRFLSDPSVRQGTVSDTDLIAVRFVAENFESIGHVVETITLEPVVVFADVGLAYVCENTRDVHGISRDDLAAYPSRAFDKFRSW
jgi:hypothetical protein